MENATPVQIHWHTKVFKSPLVKPLLVLVFLITNKQTNQCLTLGSGGGVGGVADGSVYQVAAAGLSPLSSRGYKKTAGQWFVYAEAHVVVSEGGIVVKRRSIRPLISWARNLHGPKWSQVSLSGSQMKFSRKHLRHDHLTQIMTSHTQRLFTKMQHMLKHFRTPWLDRPIQSEKPSVLAILVKCSLCWASWTLARWPPRSAHCLRASYQDISWVRTS